MELAASTVYRVSVSRELADRIKCDRRVDVWSRRFVGEAVTVVFRARRRFHWTQSETPTVVDVQRLALPSGALR